MTSSDVMSDDAPTGTAPRLQRSRRDRVLAGVCGGLGEYFGIESVWFRIAFVALAFGGGAGVLLYLIAWIAIPELPAGSVEHVGTGSRSGTGLAIVGAVLITSGVVWLFGKFLPDLAWIAWPLVLIGVGAGIVVKGMQR